MRYLLACLFLLIPLLASSADKATGAVVTTEHVRAELMAYAPEGVEAGKPMWAGLALKHIPGWHTYWRNPGDSGMPVTLNWQLPAGMAAGDIAWPLARAFPVGPMTNYGYDGEVLLPVPVKVSRAPSGEFAIKLQADWLVCADICIPEEGSFVLTVPANGKAMLSQHRARFEASLAKVPREDDAVRASARLASPLQLQLDVSGLPASFHEGPVRLMVEEPGVMEHAGKITVAAAGGALRVLAPVSVQRSASPASMHAVLVDEDTGDARRIAFKLDGGWVAPGATAAASTQPAPAPVDAGLLLTIGLALLGGALLNLMPCVFPVLSLKVLGFAQHTDDRRRIVRGGLAYTAGVILSFLTLAGVLLLLRQGGAQLGWGFQLQSPVFIALLAALFTLIGLNLAGMFEFGAMLPSSLTSMRANNPTADDFLTGVLAVAVASPCTAPFMGAAIGAAIFRPAAEALLVFGAIGLGMALPYLAAALSPRIAAMLPRPGNWMVRFKQLMAFPMFATVIWLLWVLGQQVGSDGLVAVLAVLLVLALAIYLQSMGKAGLIAGIALFAASAWWAAPALRPLPPAASTASGDWTPWSAQAVDAARQEGRAVFVDFTAAWCITCQVNKRLVLNDAETKQAFAHRKVALMRADWTARDPAITAELAKLGRNGVPVYALYAPGSAAPVLLPELLSIDEVKKAVAALPGP